MPSAVVCRLCAFSRVEYVYSQLLCDVAMCIFMRFPQEQWLSYSKPGGGS